MVEETLRLENITYHDEYHQSLHSVWLNVQKHEIVGLLGLNNSGTSTLTKILCGMLPFTQGRFYLGEELVKFSSYRQAKAHGIFYIDSFRQLFDNLNIAENIFLTHNRQNRFFLNKRLLVRQTHSCLAALQIGLSPDQKVRELTSSQKLSVLLAKALAEHARLIIIDNLLSTLTDGQFAEICHILQLLSKNGMSIVISEFVPRPLLPICRRIFVLREGQIASVCKASQVDEELLSTLMVGTETNREDPPCPSLASESDNILEFSHVSVLRSIPQPSNRHPRSGRCLGKRDHPSIAADRFHPKWHLGPPGLHRQQQTHRPRARKQRDLSQLDADGEHHFASPTRAQLPFRRHRPPESTDGI